MAQIKIQLEKGELTFYLDDREVRRNSRIELLKDNTWVTGCLRLATDPLGLVLVPDTLEIQDEMNVTQKSDFRFSSSGQGNHRTYLDTIGMLKAHYKSDSLPHLDVVLKGEKLILTLLGRTVKIGDKVLLQKRGDWIPGHVTITTKPFRIIFVSENHTTVRLDAMHRLKWPERHRRGTLDTRNAR